MTIREILRVSQKNNLYFSKKSPELAEKGNVPAAKVPSSRAMRAITCARIPPASGHPVRQPVSPPPPTPHARPYQSTRLSRQGLPSLAIIHECHSLTNSKSGNDFNSSGVAGVLWKLRTGRIRYPSIQPDLQVDSVGEMLLPVALIHTPEG